MDLFVIDFIDTKWMPHFLPSHFSVWSWMKSSWCQKSKICFHGIYSQRQKCCSAETTTNNVCGLCSLQRALHCGRYDEATFALVQSQSCRPSRHKLFVLRNSLKVQSEFKKQISAMRWISTTTFGQTGSWRAKYKAMSYIYREMNKQTDNAITATPISR